MEQQQSTEQDYKPNLYPIMYWAILYGVIAALALLALKLLSDYITVLWFPVFLAGLIWGGFRKYKQDKAIWMQGRGIVSTKKSAIEEFKDAAKDITQATQEMVTRHAQEDAVAVQVAQEAEVAQQELAIQDEVALPESPEQPAEDEKIITQQPENK